MYSVERIQSCIQLTNSKCICLSLVVQTCCVYYSTTSKHRLNIEHANKTNAMNMNLSVLFHPLFLPLASLLLSSEFQANIQLTKQKKASYGASNFKIILAMKLSRTTKG